MGIFPNIVDELMDDSFIPEINKRFDKAFQYNVPDGNMYTGLIVVTAYKLLEDAKNLTPENIRLANVMGCCVEMVGENWIKIAYNGDSGFINISSFYLDVAKSKLYIIYVSRSR